MSEISVVIEGIIFRNEENSYTVLEGRYNGDLTTVVGCFPPFGSGETVVFAGRWDEHPLYGPQFKANRYQLEVPTSLRGIERFLGSGFIKGIGPATARLIVEAFGKNTLNILDEHPERLMEVSGIGPVKYQMITESYAEQSGIRKNMVFLQGYDISPNLSMKIIKHYGQAVEECLRTNPYRLIDDIEGIGFMTADRIAKAMGFAQNSDFRLKYGIKYTLLSAATNEGHTYLPFDTLVRRAAELLSAPPELINTHLNHLILSHELRTYALNNETALTLPFFLKAEREIAIRLNRHVLCAEREQDARLIKSRIREFEEAHRISFSTTQCDAIERAAHSGLLVITGGPGTGKTTIINCILHVNANRENTLLAAPTGRAAKRMSESTGHEAKTIHRMLEYSGDGEEFQYNSENPLDCDCLIIDELSMVDVYLMKSLLRALKPETQLILVGDADQLPSVGPGNILGDILKSSTLPSVRLNEIFRQESESMIILNAHRIQHGDMPLLNKKGSDFYFERKPSAHLIAQTIVELCTQRIPAFLANDNPLACIQVLSPTKKGACGVANLNRLLQAALNPPKAEKKELAATDLIFREGDKVIHTKNNYHLSWVDEGGKEGEGVFNGDIGYIQTIDEEEKNITVFFDDEKSVIYDYKQLEDLELAYCLSVHKSQGSEFQAVIMPVFEGPPMLLTRNLFYTAMTRARKLVVLVGNDYAIERMVKNDQIMRRYTLLDSFLTEIEKEL